MPNDARLASMEARQMDAIWARRLVGGGGEQGYRPTDDDYKKPSKSPRNPFNPLASSRSRGGTLSEVIRQYNTLVYPLHPQTQSSGAHHNPRRRCER